MGYKDENIKHRLGFADEPRYRCPNCGHGLNIPKKIFMGICSKCNKPFKGEDVIESSPWKDHE